MSSREEILQRIKQNTLTKHEMPSLAIDNPLQYEDIIQTFCDMCKGVGGDYHLLQEGEDINEIILRKYPEAKRIGSALPEISCATFNPNEVELAQELNGTDVAVIRGEIGVAENAAVWIPQKEKHKAIYFIAEALVILVNREDIVTNMHEAYRWLDGQSYKFGVFISGPSKTADIEQALVFGAHGARDVLVIVI